MYVSVFGWIRTGPDVVIFSISRVLGTNERPVEGRSVRGVGRPHYVSLFCVGFVCWLIGACMVWAELARATQANTLRLGGG